MSKVKLATFQYRDDPGRLLVEVVNAWDADVTVKRRTRMSSLCNNALTNCLSPEILVDRLGDFDVVLKLGKDEHPVVVKRPDGNQKQRQVRVTLPRDNKCACADLVFLKEREELHRVTIDLRQLSLIKDDDVASCQEKTVNESLIKAEYVDADEVVPEVPRGQGPTVVPSTTQAEGASGTQHPSVQPSAPNTSPWHQGPQNNTEIVPAFSTSSNQPPPDPMLPNSIGHFPPYPVPTPVGGVPGPQALPYPPAGGEGYMPMPQLGAPRPGIGFT